jgi:hypothetical protein
MLERYFTNTNHPYNGCGSSAVTVQFHMKDLDEIRKWIISKGGKIDVEKSYEEELKHYQHLIDIGNYSYYCDDKNGIPFNELPLEAQEKIGPGRWDRRDSKWSKWTPEKLLEQRGWEEGEVYWFSLHKDNTYTYQLILKEGDWICREYYEPNGRYFYNVDYDCTLPYNSEWKEIENVQ